MCKNNSESESEIAKSEIAKIVWAKLTYTDCQIKGNDTTIIEIKDVWEMINEIENIIKIKQDALNYNVKQNINLMKKFKNMP